LSQTTEQHTTASALASAANNTDTVIVLIVGAGHGGLAMLDVLRHYDWVHIHAIIDIDEKAIAFALAKKLGIQTSTARQQVLDAFNGDIIIDVTGDLNMAEKITNDLESRHIELIAGKSAKLVFDLVNTQLRHTDLRLY